MLFTTIVFWSIFILFLLMFPLFRQLSPVAMMTYVVAFSLAIFMKGNGWMTIVLLGVALFTWTATRYMCVLQGRRRTFMLAFTIIADLLPLLYFKYAVAAADLWNAIQHSNFSFSTIVVPAGISFFTFQAISYVIDVHKKRFTENVNLLEFLFYLTFFPIIFAGPITRAEVFFANFRRKEGYISAPLPPISALLSYTGVWLIMSGLIKKLVIADYIAQYNDWIFDDPSAFSGFEVLMGTIGYSVQIFCDFSGYSDISIGMAALLGVRLPENFNYPYRSLNVTEFWHRWHISLSSWFRDYLYIPLGGSRCGSLRTYFNLFLTMIVAGLWHGSTVMFILWGAIHGAALIIHKACKGWLDRIPDNCITRFAAWLLTFFFVVAAWVFFRSDSLATCSIIFSKIFLSMDMDYFLPFLSARTLWVILLCLTAVAHAIHRDLHHRLIGCYVRTPLYVKVLLFLIVVQICIQFHSSSVQPFIYYRF